jgi:TRAP-type C4-dicarboxylate transport system permease small subunit
MSALSRIRNGLVRGLEIAVVALMAGLVLDVLWQVASRYVLQRPSAWTDELATILVIWLALLGAAVAFARGEHLGVDVVVRMLPPLDRRLAAIVAEVVVLFFAVAVLILGGSRLVSLAWLTGQISPALNLRIGDVYLALPISGGFTALFAVEGILRHCGFLKPDPPAGLEGEGEGA